MIMELSCATDASTGNIYLGGYTDPPHQELPQQVLTKLQYGGHTLMPF